MEGYQREKNSQAILATNLTALHRHRNSLKEKKQMKNKINTLEKKNFNFFEIKAIVVKSDL